MKILALGGCGQQGALAVKTLIEADDVEKVVIADINLAAAQAFQKKLNSDKIDVLEVNVLDEDVLLAAMKDVDLVANFVGPFFKFAEPVAKAAIACGVNYVDICDDVVPTQTLLDDYHDKAKAAGISMLLGMGASPGITNILARHGANQLDHINKVGVYWAVSVNDIESEISDDGESAAIYEHAIELMAANALQFIDGKYTDFQGGAGLENIAFATLGKQAAYYVSHPEPATLPRYIKADNIVNKGCAPGLDEVLFAFQGLGLANHEGVVKVKGTEYKATDIAIAVLAYLDANMDPVPESELPACSDLLVELEGQRNGESIKIRLDLLATDGLPRMDRATGITAAIGVLMMGRGQITEKGVHAPEGCVEPEAFIAELEKYNFEIKETIS
ncbi:MAG: saccharopine dehydrogenase NADP-binding domain-containing protein [Colwellia sp.]|jgi:Saccharopine dehydrogenase and related proteins